MLDIVLESLIALLLAIMVVRFMKIGVKDFIRNQPGWRQIFGGTVMILVAQLFDISDNFPALDVLVVVGDTGAEAFIEEGGRLGGYLLLAIGFWKWLPVLEELEVLKADLESKDRSLVAAAEDLISEEELAGAITTAAKDAIFTVDGQGVITFCNPAAARMFEYEIRELLGKNLHLLLAQAQYHDDNRKDFAAFIQNGGGLAVGQTIEASALKKSGREFPIEVSMSPMRIGSDWHALGIIRDISERRENEREKLELAKQLRQAQKMEAIGTLAGGIAHDFNNILSAIIGFGEMVLDELPDPGPLRENQEQVVNAGHRAKGLVKQILTFSRGSEEEKGPLLMQFVVKEATKFLRASVPTTIEMVVEIDGDCGPVLADPGQIHQLVMNLCTNAYQAMRETGGVMRVSLKAVEFSAAEAATRINLQPGRYGLLEVGDTGHGMERTVRERIFEPYFTTKPQGDGTGLGLAVVHGIVMNLRGDIEVVSAPGEGATFRIYLPCIEEPMVETVPEAAESLPRGSERVMVVDDDEIVVIMVGAMLQNLGYRVATYGDSASALQSLREDPQGFDLLLTDMTMPKLTGAELAVAAMRIRPELPVIICTGFSDQLDAAKAKALGIREYMLKPVEKDELAVTLRRVLVGDFRENS